MARDMGPVLKKCRSLGIEPSYLGIDKKSNRKNARAGKKVSEYGLQLREKQKAKFIYGVLEKPFRNDFEKAKKLKFVSQCEGAACKAVAVALDDTYTGTAPGGVVTVDNYKSYNKDNDNDLSKALAGAVAKAS